MSLSFVYSCILRTLLCLLLLAILEQQTGYLAGALLVAGLGVFIQRQPHYARLGLRRLVFVSTLLVDVGFCVYLYRQYQLMDHTRQTNGDYMSSLPLLLMLLWAGVSAWLLLAGRRQWHHLPTPLGDAPRPPPARRPSPPPVPAELRRPAAPVLQAPPPPPKPEAMPQAPDRLPPTPLPLRAEPRGPSWLRALKWVGVVISLGLLFVAVRTGNALLMLTVVYSLSASLAVELGFSLPRLLPDPRLVFVLGLVYFVIKSMLHLYLWQSAARLAGVHAGDNTWLVLGLLICGCLLGTGVSWAGLLRYNTVEGSHATHSGYASWPLLLPLLFLLCMLRASNTWTTLVLGLLAIVPAIMLNALARPPLNQMPGRAWQSDRFQGNRDLRETLDALDNADVHLAGAALAALVMLRDLPHHAPRFCTYGLGPALVVGTLLMVRPLSTVLVFSDSTEATGRAALLGLSLLLALVWWLPVQAARRTGLDRLAPRPFAGRP